MIQQDELRNIALQAGLSKAEIDRIYGDAIDEADALGKGKDDDFVLQIVKIFAGLNEEDYLKTIKELIAKKSKDINEKKTHIKNYKLAKYIASKGFEQDLIFDLLKKEG